SNFDAEDVSALLFAEPLEDISVTRNITQASIDAWIKECQTHETVVDFDELLGILGLDAEFRQFVHDHGGHVKTAADGIRADEELQRIVLGTGRRYSKYTYEELFRGFYQHVWQPYEDDRYSYDIVDVSHYPILNTDISTGLVMVNKFGACESGRDDEPTTDIHGAYIPIVSDATISASGLTSDALRDICPCVHAMWIVQPTRIFIPVFYANGGHLDILVFTRNQLLRTRLGRMMDYAHESLLFTHTQPSDDQTIPKAAQDGGVFTRSIANNHYPRGHELSVMSSLHREESGMFGPLTVVYNSDPYSSKRALGGHPVDEPPTEDCLNIPGLVDCGVIVPEFMGYTQRYAVFKNMLEPMYRVVDKINRWRAIVSGAAQAESAEEPATPAPNILPALAELPALEPSSSFTAVGTPLGSETGSPTRGKLPQVQDNHCLWARVSCHLRSILITHRIQLLDRHRLHFATIGYCFLGEEPSSPPPHSDRMRSDTLVEPFTASRGTTKSRGKEVAEPIERMTRRKRPAPQPAEPSTHKMLLRKRPAPKSQRRR
ncbi:hypothetical protein DL89DRAFT_266289, partial [Linderina pennispora]